MGSEPMIERIFPPWPDMPAEFCCWSSVIDSSTLVRRHGCQSGSWRALERQPHFRRQQTDGDAAFPFPHQAAAASAGLGIAVASKTTEGEGRAHHTQPRARRAAMPTVERVGGPQPKSAAHRGQFSSDRGRESSDSKPDQLAAGINGTKLCQPYAGGIDIDAGYLLTRIRPETMQRLCLMF